MPDFDASPHPPTPHFSVPVGCSPDKRRLGEDSVTASVGRDHCRVYCFGKQESTPVEKREEPLEFRK